MARHTVTGAARQVECPVGYRGCRWRTLVPNVRRLLEVLPQHLGAGGVAQLRQRLGLDLTNPLARHAEFPADLFEGSRVTVGQAEAQLDDALLPIRKGAQDVLQLVLEENE